MVLCIMNTDKEPLKSFEIRVGYSPGFRLPFVAILPWLCRKRRKAIFIYIGWHHTRRGNTSWIQCCWVFYVILDRYKRWLSLPEGLYQTHVSLLMVAMRPSSVLWGKMKWNEWGFTPHLSMQIEAKLSRRPSSGWCDEWDDTALQTQNSNCKPWPDTLPLGHGGSPQYRIFKSERWRNILFLLNLKAIVGLEPAISDFPSRQL